MMAREIESEKTLERLLKSTVESKMKGLCVKLLSECMTGLPDRMCLLPGQRMFFVELKTTGKKPRKIQEHVHKLLRNLGFAVFVIDSTDSLMKMLHGYGLQTEEEKTQGV